MLAPEQVARLDAYGLGPRAGREYDRVALQYGGVDEGLGVEQPSEHGSHPVRLRGVTLQLVLGGQMHGWIGERLPDEAHVEPPGRRDDGDRVSPSRVDHHRLEE